MAKGDDVTQAMFGSPAQNDASRPRTSEAPFYRCRCPTCQCRVFTQHTERSCWFCRRNTHTAKARTKMPDLRPVGRRQEDAVDR